MSALYPCSKHITPAVDSLHETLKIYNPTRDVYYKMNMHKVMRLWHQALGREAVLGITGRIDRGVYKKTSACRTVRSAV